MILGILCFVAIGYIDAPCDMGMKTLLIWGGFIKIFLGVNSLLTCCTIFNKRIGALFSCCMVIFWLVNVVYAIYYLVGYSKQSPCAQGGRILAFIFICMLIDSIWQLSKGALVCCCCCIGISVFSGVSFFADMQNSEEEGRQVPN